MKNENQIRVDLAVHRIATNTEQLIEYKTSLAVYNERLNKILNKEKTPKDVPFKTHAQIDKINARIVELEFQCELIEEQNERLNWLIQFTIKQLIEIKEDIEIKLEKLENK